MTTRLLFVFLLVIFASISLKNVQVDSAFVYYQNYEYISTVKLNEYSGYYGNVKLLRFLMPIDVLIGIWKLQLIATDSCPATNFYFYLDHAGFPVISPHNTSFPKYFSSGRLTKLFVNQTISGKPSQNKQDLFLNVTSPPSGYWYSASFVDSNDQAVKPDFLRLNCSFFLTASLSIWQINDTVPIYPNMPISSTDHQMFKIYKFITSSLYSGPLEFKVAFNSTDLTFKKNCSITALVKQSAFPDMNTFNNNDNFINCNSNQQSNINNASCRLAIDYPLVNTIYYLAISSNCSYTVEANVVANCSFAKNLDVFVSSNQKAFANLNPYIATSILNNSSSPSTLATLAAASATANNSNNSNNNNHMNNSLDRNSSERTINKLKQSSSSYATTASDCGQLAEPTETFRFIGPSYFAVKYYFNSNYNRSNALLIQNDRKPYFIEFLVDLANHGGTLNFYLVNNLVLDPSYSSSSASASSFNNQQQPPPLTNSSQQTYQNTSSSSNNSNNTFSPFENNNNNNNNQLDSNKVLSTLNYLNATPFENNFMAAYSKKINDFNISNVRVMLKVCLLYEKLSNYLNCPEGYGLSTQSNINLFTNLQLSVPYPMLGRWFLAVWKECYDAGTNQSIPCPVAYVPYAVIQMSSDQCSNDYCSEYGNCFIVNSQLNVFSACKCIGGYEGYGCTDSRNAISSKRYLASVLFLTLSNLMFVLPIATALYRGWYIESLIYFYNMFFSTFYHACDQDFFSFCIFNYDGLQLADFISSYSSFVITILSMSVFTRPWKVFSFFVGLLACLSINLYDRFNYVAFVVFLLISLGVTVFTWVRICYTKRKLYPDRHQLLKYYLPGFLLAIAGLLIYSFLQTKNNYWVLHSVWHMCMAASIIFFLPKREANPGVFRVISTCDNRKEDAIVNSSSINDSTGSSSINSSNANNNSNLAADDMIKPSNVQVESLLLNTEKD